MKILRSSWTPGPDVSAPGPLLVSLTDYTAERHLDLPGIARAGMRLRAVWSELDGAIGMWLWTLPFERRAGSVSVWADETALHGFVARADHRKIMRRYRSRGTIQASSWPVAAALDRREIWLQAAERLRRKR